MWPFSQRKRANLTSVSRPLSSLEVRSKIVQFVVERSVADESDLGPGATLFSSGLLGSIDLVHMVLFIEKEFGVRLSESMRVSPETIDSLDGLVRDVLARRRP
jgi:acyl carrier protein